MGRSPLPDDGRPYRSVSQYNQYNRCPYSFKLARVDKRWKRPAAWLYQGTAVHAACEARERSGGTMTLEEAQTVFREVYSRDTNTACDVTPNMDWWSASGPYRGKQDIARRYGLGLEQVERYYRWREAHPEEEIWVAPDGQLAVELEFDVDLDGVRVVGYIDAVVLVDGEPRVRDVKTGNNPGDDFQLGTYKAAIEKKYGVVIPTGDYWMGRPGKPTYPFDLTDWTVAAVAAEFKALDENIRAGRFDPDPEPDKCRFCDVSYWCRYSMS